MTVRALPCHPWPLTNEQLAALKQAKAELNLDYQIQPVRAAIAVPLPVLAFEELPPFLCTVALIKPGWTVQNVKAALHTVLEDPESERLFGELQYLQAFLGPEVREVTDGVGVEVHTDATLDPDRARQHSVAFR